MAIRKATPADSEIISKLVCQLSEKYIANEFSSRGRETLLNSMTPAAIKAYIQSGYRYHVAMQGNHLVGVVGVKENRHLYHLFVDENHQRQGIASKLWRIASKACLDEGNPGVFTVSSSTYAKAVYEHLGFVAESGPQNKSDVIVIPMKLSINLGK